MRPWVDQIIDLNHPLAKLARQIDWRFLEDGFGAVCKDGPGHPPLPTRLMAGLALLKHASTSLTKLCASAGWRTPITNIYAAKSSSSIGLSSIARP
jgi:hypothetical protein